MTLAADARHGLGGRGHLARSGARNGKSETFDVEREGSGQGVKGGFVLFGANLIRRSNESIA